MADPNQMFAVWLRAARKQAGLSQQKIADALTAEGLPFVQQQVNRIEQGERAIRLDEAVVLVRLFGMTLDDALGMRSGPDSVGGERAARRTVLLREIRESIDAELGGAL